MTSPIFWILDESPEHPGRLAIILRPGGGQSLVTDVTALRTGGIRLVVSLLPPEESRAMGLDGEEAACRELGLGFRNYPMRDFGVPPSLKCGAQLLEDLVGAMSDGETVGIHCRGSIGRSGTMTAALLVRLGMQPEEAFHEVSIRRGALCPETEMQRDWVREYARALREGRF